MNLTNQHATALSNIAHHMECSGRPDMIMQAATVRWIADRIEKLDARHTALEIEASALRECVVDLRKSQVEELHYIWMIRKELPNGTFSTCAYNSLHPIYSSTVFKSDAVKEWLADGRLDEIYYPKYDHKKADKEIWE